MTIEKINPEFADTGSKDTDAVFNDWASAAWVDERCRYKGMNKVLNRADSKINEAIDRLPKALHEDEDELPYIQGLFTPANDFSNAAADLNIFDLSGDVSAIKDICYAKIAGSRKILLVDLQAADDDPIKIFDIEAGTVSGCGDLSSDLSTPTTDWTAISICCDETYCYVVFRDEGPSPDEFRAQSWSLADWSVNAGWPATGLALTAGSVAVDDICVRIRNATNDKLVVTQPWVAVSSGTSSGLNIISKANGTSEGTGAGNVGSVSNGQVLGVCSDGTYVYFAVGLAANVYICGMTIASPGASGPSTEWPYDYDGGDSSCFGGIACSGNLIVATWNNYTDARIFTIHSADDGQIAEYSTGDQKICKELGAICFDGKNFWALGDRSIGGVEDRTFLFELKGANRGGTYQSGNESVTDGELYTECYLAIFESGSSYNLSRDAELISDGRDLWFRTTFDQKLRRLPKSLIR